MAKSLIPFMSRLHFLSRLLLPACVLVPLSGALAQVAVVDASGNSIAPSSTGDGASITAPAPAASASGELFFQLQLLQDEMMQLRGIIEEQQHQIRQLKQQRLDDYLSLDKRISELYDAGAMAPSTGTSTAASSGSQVVAGSGEESAYKNAYGLVRAKSFTEATAALQTFLKSYPAGKYAPNAHYWLGELHLLAPNLEEARQSFTQLLDQYPDHRKVPDATFKLAKVYHLQGDSEKSKMLLDKVIDTYGNSSSSAVKLAKDYLQKNF